MMGGAEESNRSALMMRDGQKEHKSTVTIANETLPRVIVSSVIRATRHGQSHGGLYIVDLATQEMTQVLDWKDVDIEWTGRGGERGLRGIAFHGGNVYLAASGEILIFDQRFEAQGSIRNPYLKDCHEISIDGDSLYLTSTGFDSILRYDLCERRFVAGCCFRYDQGPLNFAKRLPSLLRRMPRQLVRFHPRMRRFDPEQPGGPIQRDTTHINSVTARDGRIYVSGVGLQHLYCIENEKLSSHAKIPFGTHNSQPFGDGVIYNNTSHDHVVVQDGAGSVQLVFPVKRYEESELLNTELALGVARQAFGRGLAVWQDRFLIAGSSPATVTVYDLLDRRPVTSVNLTKDVRNAVHGLEVWPFGGTCPPVGSRED